MDSSLELRRHLKDVFLNSYIYIQLYIYYESSQNSRTLQVGELLQLIQVDIEKGCGFPRKTCLQIMNFEGCSISMLIYSMLEA